MSATPPLKTDTSSGRVGRVAIANSYDVSGPLGVTPAAQIQVNGSDDAFQQPPSGTVAAAAFPGRVVAIGPAPGDYTGTNTVTDSVLVRFTSTARILTMPANPWDGMRVAVVDADGTSSNTNLTQVGAAAGHSIQDPYNRNRLIANPSRVSVYIPYQRIEWEWNQTASAWLVASDSAAGELPSQAFATGTTAILGKVWMKCSPSGAITLNLPSSPTEGLTIKVSDIIGAAATHNITVTATGGWNIDVLTLGGPGGSAVIATNNQSATWTADVTNKVWRLTAINGPHA